MSAPDLERRRARARAFLAAAALICLATGGFAGASSPPAARLLHPYRVALPGGPGGRLAGRACTLCHSTMLIAQQHKDSTGWEKTLATMQKWGAPLTPSERDTLRGYLVTQFGPVPRH